MDLYVTTLAIGGVGLVAMAATGFTHGGHGHGGHGHGGGHAGHAGHGGHGGGHAGHGGHGSAAHGHAGHANGHGGPQNNTALDHGHAGIGSTAAHAASNALLTLVSPRFLFSACLGFGATGMALRGTLGGGVFLLAAAAAGAVIFERLLVTPLWNLAFRFESEPAHTLESAFGGDATAVTGFDANGQGLVAIEVDGQVVQLLGTLQASDRALPARIPAGTKLRVEDVDSARNRCTVSVQ